MGHIVAQLTTANTVKSPLVCEECGAEFVIIRTRGRLRERGHIKHVWCHVCREVTAHVERMSAC